MGLGCRPNRVDLSMQFKFCRVIGIPESKRLISLRSRILHSYLSESSVIYFPTTIISEKHKKQKKHTNVKISRL